MRPLAAAAALLMAACGERHEPFQVFGSIPGFTLTSQSGEEFHSARQLEGKVWVADFIFTNCTGPCPRMTSQMRQVQEGLAGSAARDIRLVSFTVDPARDTPEVLAAYGRRNHADFQRWIFLTGPMETLHKLKREAFLLGNVDGSLIHSTRFVLVDRRGRVRRFHDTTSPGAVRDVIADALRLARDSS